MGVMRSVSQMILLSPSRRRLSVLPAEVEITLALFVIVALRTVRNVVMGQAAVPMPRM